MRSFAAPPALEIFAVEDSSAQFVWRMLPTGGLTLRLTALANARDRTDRSHTINVSTDGLPGSVDIYDLIPNRNYRLQVTGTGLPARGHIETFRTLPPPPGERLLRLATMNDLHIGVSYFGVVGTMRERNLGPDDEASGLRCARAAFAQASAWGVDRFVFKGDMVHTGAADEWAAARELIEATDTPWDMVLGNHELKLDPQSAVAELKTWGYDASEPVRVRDLPGLRLVFVESAEHRTDRGTLANLHDSIVDAARTTDLPVMIFLHHNLQVRDPAWMLPVGIPARQATPLLDDIARVKPTALVASGHTHRHRRRDHKGVQVIEVGSTKDFPGTWAGYDIYEGGVRQVVRRVVGPAVQPWLDRTRHVALTAWGRWSPGRFDDRCFTHHW